MKHDISSPTSNASPFYATFIKLCSSKGLSPSAVAQEAGISSGAPTAWKKGSIPKPAQRKKLCEYFGVTDTQLLGYGLGTDALPWGKASDELTELKQKKTPSDSGEGGVPHAQYREVLAGEGIRLLLDADAKVPQEHLDEIIEFIKFKQQQYGR